MIPDMYPWKVDEKDPPPRPGYKVVSWKERLVIQDLVLSPGVGGPGALLREAAASGELELVAALLAMDVKLVWQVRGLQLCSLLLLLLLLLLILLLLLLLLLLPPLLLLLILIRLLGLRVNPNYYNHHYYYYYYTTSTPSTSTFVSE